LPGRVPRSERSNWWKTDQCLAQAARLVREFHDLTSTSDLSSGAEVVCHNDLSPRNTVFRRLGGVWVTRAFIDWDLAAPGERVQDLAHLCWQFLNLGPEVREISEAVRQLHLMAEAYGLGRQSNLVATILWWQDRCWQGIEDRAASGESAMIRLRDSGA